MGELFVKTAEAKKPIRKEFRSFITAFSKLNIDERMKYDFNFILKKHPELQQEKGYDWFVNKYYIKPLNEQNPLPKQEPRDVDKMILQGGADLDLASIKQFEQSQRQPQPIVHRQDTIGAYDPDYEAFVQPSEETLEGASANVARLSASPYQKFEAGVRRGLAKGLTLGFAEPPNSENLGQIANPVVEGAAELAGSLLPWGAVGNTLQASRLVRNFRIAKPFFGRVGTFGAELSIIGGLEKEELKKLSNLDGVGEYAINRVQDFALGSAFGTVLGGTRFKMDKANALKDYMGSLNKQHNLGINMESLPNSYWLEKVAESDFQKFLGSLANKASGEQKKAIINKASRGKFGLDLFQRSDPVYNDVPAYAKKFVSESKWGEMSSMQRDAFMNGEMSFAEIQRQIYNPIKNAEQSASIFNDAIGTANRANQSVVGAEGLRTRLQTEEALSPLTLAGPEERLLLEAPQGLRQTVGENPGILREYPFPEGPIDTRSPLQKLADMYKEQQTSAVKGLQGTTPKGSFANEGAVGPKSQARQSAEALESGLNERDQLLKSPIGKEKLRQSLSERSVSVETLEDKWSKQGVKLSLYQDKSGKRLSINDINVQKSSRKQGVGSQVMDDIIKYADENNLRVELTPGVPEIGTGTTSRARLIKFYKRFGFEW